MIKRVALFLLTNLMVILTISIVFSLLGINSYLTSQGIDYKALLIFCTIWGMGGAVISLYLSKWIAKTSMKVALIDPKSASGQERFLLDIVYSLARRAGLREMPEVGIYDSPELNAFATGPSKSNSLVAVSSGLLQRMNQNEIEGVLGHEVSHVANGDMVTMTLIQGTINAFSMFLSRVIAYAVSMALNRGESSSSSPGAIYYVLVVVFDVTLTLLGSMVVAAFSRYREYRADAGGAKIAGKTKMIDALKQLQLASSNEAVTAKQIEEEQRTPALAALKISHKSKWLGLLSTHPPLEDRILRVENMRVS